MKIDDPPKSDKTITRTAPEPGTPVTSGSARRQAVTVGIDRVHLSPRAQEFQKTRQTLATLPDIDADKVAEVRARLQSGRYQVDAEKIARQMLNDRLDAED